MAAREEAERDRQFGPYRLAQLIATGGMAEIHLAKTRGIEGFEKYVALKMIHPNFSSDDHFIQMLIDEAKISVQLQHVNIAHTFDLGRVGDTYYIAMEFVDGSDLFRILRKASEQDRYMPIETAAYIAKEVAAGLDYAHHKRDASGRSMGIVHRDVSPQNVLISHAGEVKIVDFGIAKATMRAKQTAVGVIKGKYYYMSPEQAWGDPVDHRTDIFSAGILLYEMLTGQMLYLEEDMTKLLDMVRRADIPPPSTKRREVPRELDRIVMRALAKKPDLRWQSAQDYGTELEKFLHGFAPDFTASRLASFVSEVMGPPAPRQQAKPEAPKRVEEESSPRVTRGIERKSIVLSRSEFTDENSVIFNAALGAPPKATPVAANRMTSATSSPPVRFPANRMTTPSGALPPPRPPPLPQAVKPLAARLAEAAAAAPREGTIDIDDVDLEPLDAEPEVKERSADNTAERTADVRPPAPPPAPAEPPADEDPTVLDVAGLAGRTRGAGTSTRPMEPARSSPPPVQRVSSSRPVVEPPPEDKPPAPRPSRRTPAAVPVLKAAEPQAQSSGSSLPLAAPVEPTEDRPPPPAASSVWPPSHTTDEDGDDFFGFKIAGRVGRRQLVIAILGVAVLLGLGALAVAVFSPAPGPAYATVEVISIPSRARVTVDNRDFGVTPLSLERVALDRPFHLRVELPQHEPWERTEQLSEARHVKVVASLKPILGRLHVDSSPVGAEVFVNNRSVGFTPLDRADQSPFVDGTVEVRKQGYKPSRQALEWKGQREVKLSFDLVPARD